MTITIQQLMQWKQQGRAIAVLTAYDYGMARLLDTAGVDVILVGDSLAMALMPIWKKGSLKRSNNIVRR